MIPTPTLIPWDPGQFASMRGVESGISNALYDTSTWDNSGSFTVRIFGCATPPTPPPTPTPVPTVTPTPRQAVTIFFGGTAGDNTAVPGPDPYCQSRPWTEVADTSLPYPGSNLTTTGKRRHADMGLALNILSDSDVFVIGYSGGADSALIFANDFVLARQNDGRSGRITGLILLGATLSGSVTGIQFQDDLIDYWSSYLDRILATGTYVYIHDDKNGLMSGTWDTFPDTPDDRFEHVISSAEHLDNGGAVITCKQPSIGLGTNNSYAIRDTILNWFDIRNVVR